MTTQLTQGIYMCRSEQYNCQMNVLIYQAGVKGMSERSELIPCHIYKITNVCLSVCLSVRNGSGHR